jgi:hypothetical protein
MIRILLGTFIVAHGLLTAVIWAMPANAEAPFQATHSWLVGDARPLAVVIALVAAAGLVPAGIGFIGQQAWWAFTGIGAGAAALALAGGHLAAPVGVRRWHQHWGASDQEITKPLPGDDLVPAARLDSTQAITIHAPAERIWPWLAQMGYGDRAGSYSHDRFERSIGRNLYQLDPDIPPLVAGAPCPSTRARR